MTMRQVAANGALVLLSIVAGVVLCEAAARLVLNPADYLSVTTRPDDVLGMTIEPHTAGLDGWGFRNPSVPSSVDVVALGDSHTFGNTATMDDAWPSVLARETGRSVYNLGLGGYGPNQYFHLLETRGLTLHPKIVLAGLYMGDDFENAFSITYGLDHWASLRSRQSAKTVNADIWDEGGQPGTLKPLRDWLSRESVTYRLLVHGALLGSLKERIRFGQVGRGEDPLVTSLVVDSEHIREAFRPTGLANRLDQSNLEVREGMRITFFLLKNMDRLCRAHGCQFGVVIIPTKETVFAEYLDRAPQLHLKDTIEKLVANERAARQELGEFLDEAGIPYVDTLPALRRAAGQQLYARTTADMHPSGNGYRVIAGAVAEFAVARATNN